MMGNKSNQTQNTNDGSTRKFNIAGGQDLPDSPEDQKRLQPETTTIDLPDVEGYSRAGKCKAGTYG